MSSGIYNVDATALFFARPQADMGALLTELNAKLAGHEGCHLGMSDLSHDNWWLLTCTHFHIMVSFADAPAPRDRLDAALRSPVTTLRRFDYAQAAQSHQSHVTVEVGDGSAPLPPEARVIMQEFGSSAQCDPELKMKALHWTAQFIAKHQGFLALHFGPSDRLFCPEELTAAAEQDSPEPLLLHPVPSLPEAGPGGVDGYRLALRNPGHLPGPSIELEGIPVSVPLATACSLLDTLYRARKGGKLQLAHGKVLKPSPKYALYARQGVADAEAPNGRMILSFWADRGHDAPLPQTGEAITPVAPVATAVHAPEVTAATPAPAAPETPGSAPAAVLTAPAPAQKPVPQPDPVLYPDPEEARRVMREAAEMRAEQDALRAEDAAPAPYMAQAPEEALVPMAHGDDTDLPEDVIAQPRKRGGLGAWIAARMRGMPTERRAKLACLALIFTLPFVSNPYDGFTGGLYVPTGAQLAQPLPHAPTQTMTATLPRTAMQTFALARVQE